MECVGVYGSGLCEISGVGSEGRAPAVNLVVIRKRTMVIEHPVAGLSHSVVEWTPFPAGYFERSASFGRFVLIEATDGKCSAWRSPYLS